MLICAKAKELVDCASRDKYLLIGKDAKSIPDNASFCELRRMALDHFNTINIAAKLRQPLALAD